MNQTDTYNSSIGNLIEPESIGYSFNTPGWYIVLGALLLTVLVIGFMRYRKYKKNAYRREALKDVEAILQQKGNNIVYEINALLKIIALRLFGRKEVASLNGLAWFQFLNATMNSENIISEMEVEKLTSVLYNPDEKLDNNSINKLADFAVLWIKNHRAHV